MKYSNALKAQNACEKNRKWMKHLNKIDILKYKSGIVESI